MTRAHWAGPSGEATKALKAIDAWIVQHENKHANDIVAKAKKAFEKDIVIIAW